MWTKRKGNIQREDGKTERAAKTLLQQMGWKGLLAIAWQSTPWSLRAIALPYTLIVYRRLLATSDSPRQLLVLHMDKYQSSLLFRTLRPRYRRMHHILKCFEIESSSTPIHPKTFPSDHMAMSVPPVSAPSFEREPLVASHASVTD
jgi:hypothetical protein